MPYSLSTVGTTTIEERHRHRYEVNNNYRARLEEAWGAKVTEAMGIGDIAVSLWGECTEQDGMHFSGRGFVHVELIDPETGARIEMTDGAEGELVYSAKVDGNASGLTRDAFELAVGYGGEIDRETETGAMRLARAYLLDEGCTDCHEGVDEHPHAAKVETTACDDCHDEAAEAAAGAGHGARRRHHRGHAGDEGQREGEARQRHQARGAGLRRGDGTVRRRRAAAGGRADPS